MPDRPCLVALSGLPGTGKTTLARRLAREVGGLHLRIDTIETALRHSALRIDPAEDAGYLAAYGIAADNLFGHNIVIADSVNPIALTRNAWAAVAADAGADLLEVEVICSDVVEHRRRVEARWAAHKGEGVPTWSRVMGRHYEPWDRPRLVIDTAQMDLRGAVEAIARRLDRGAAC